MQPYQSRTTSPSFWAALLVEYNHTKILWKDNLFMELWAKNKYSLDYNVEDQVINAIQYLSVSLWVLNSYLSYRLFFKLQMDHWFCWKPKIRKRYELTCHSVLNMFLPIRYSMHIYYFSLFSTMEGKQYRWSITKDMMSWRFYQMHCL